MALLSPKPSKSQAKSSPPDEPPSYNASVSPELTPVPSNPLTQSSPPPITTQSSSSMIRAGLDSKTAKKNVPYTPAKEQQRHIDLLKKSKNVVALTATATGSQTDYFDVLPSFQMFQSILKRDDSQFVEDLVAHPPTYGDTANSSPTPPGGLSPVNPRSWGLDTPLLDQQLEELRLRDEERDDFMMEEETPERSTPAEAVSVVHESYGHTILDNIDLLPRMPTSPIDIQIYVTKRVPQPHVSNELETRLKEYTSGDLVNGYIIITNTSDKPVDFGLFTVTLEGTVKAAERDLSSNLHVNNYKKILMKKFLKMYDLNASYGYTHIPNSVGIEYEAHTPDLEDGCLLGLPNERILQPNMKYKKFFTFRFPEKLLDNNCIHDILPHILPPPSLGLDRTCFYNRGETIQLNKILGYGYLNIRGTPILTRDYHFDDISISYTIEAKFIDKLNTKNQKEPLSQHEINNPDNESDYVIAKSTQFYLRFVPDIQQQMSYYNQSSAADTFGSLGIDGNFYQNYVQSSTWRAIHELNFQLEQEIDSRLSRDKPTELKDKNLFIGRKETTKATLDHLELKNRLNRQLYVSRGDASQDQQLYYQERRMISNIIPVTIFGKKKKKILSSLVEVGQLRIFVKIPAKRILYTSPKLLMKYNNGSIEDIPSPGVFPPRVSLPGEEDLRPAMSTGNMSLLYNRAQSEYLSAVEVELEFESLDSTTKPPKISNIETNVVAWSYNSEYPLPVQLDYDFFYYSLGLEHPHDDDVEITRNNLQFLKDQVREYTRFLTANKTFISKHSYLYLKAMKSIGIKKDTIKDYFASYTQNIERILGHDDAGWEVEQLPSKKFRWVKKFSLPLSVVNKNNVTLLPSFQTCLVGRIYCLQVLVRFKGSGGEQNEFADNVVKVDVPVLVG